MSLPNMGRVSWSVLLLWLAFAFVVHGAGDKGKSGGQPKKESKAPPKGKPLESQGLSEIMETVDYVRSGALLVGFLAINFAGRDTWLLAEVISSFSFGVAAFFFPDALLGYETDGKLDAVHLCMAQAFGAILIGLAVTVYASKDSRDRGVTGSILMARILGGAVLLQAMFIDHIKAKGDKQRWNDKHLSFSTFGAVLWVLGSLWQYIRTPSYGSGGVDLKDRLTKHLLIDLLITLPAGLYMFAFPDFHMSLITMKGFTPDGIHGHLIRSCGAMAFMSGLHGHAAMGFSDDIDKRAQLMGQLVTSLMMIPTMSLYQYKYVLVNMNVFYFFLTLHLIRTLNPMCAYFIRSKSKKN